MICKYRLSSIPTVNFKWQLPLPGSPPPLVTKTNQNASYQAYPCCQTHSSCSKSRLKAMMLVPEPTHFRDPDHVHCFCSNALKVSAKKGFLPEGKQVHTLLMKSGLYNVLSLQNQVLNVYVKCKKLDDADRLFEELHGRNVVSWNTVITGIVDRGAWKNYTWNLYLGFSYFKRMMFETFDPDDKTFNGLIRACIELNDIGMGRQLHCFTVKLGFDLECFVGSALVDLYAKCGLVEDAKQVFECVLYRDLALWNVLVSCYVLNCLDEEALNTFNLMRLKSVKGDEFTFSSLLNSCGTSGYCDFGKQVHSLAIRQSFDLDVLVASALVAMYARNENIADARQAFDQMAVRNVVSWTTMIVGYGKCREGNKAMKLVRDMLCEDFYPDELTLSSILSSGSYKSAISEIMQVHAYIVKFGFQAFISIANALIIAYSKCGKIANASQCFSSVIEPDLVTWTSMISAYTFHGLPAKANEMFEKMVSLGVVPDSIAFLGVLSACGHGGLVSKGIHYFKLMTEVYQIIPGSEHYACLIDLLGRSGLIDYGFRVLKSESIHPDSNTLGALIGSCKVQGNVGLAAWAAEKLFELEPRNTANYSLMSNMYASEGRWSDVERVRRMMGDRCNSKVPGCSWMETASGQVHSFMSGSVSHPQAQDIYETLKMLHRLMKEESYLKGIDSTTFAILAKCQASLLSVPRYGLCYLRKTYQRASGSFLLIVEYIERVLG